MNDYKLYQLNVDQNKLIEYVKISRDKFNYLYRGFEHATKFYYLYNFFTIASCNSTVYELYLQLLNCFRDYGVESSAWMQCWMNIHKQDQVLTSHSHDYPIHGYVSLSSHNTSTVFTDSHNGTELYRIDNKPMQVYIGPGHRHHHVVVNQSYDDERITLGFDLQLSDTITENFSFIPIVL